MSGAALGLALLVAFALPGRASGQASGPAEIIVGTSYPGPDSMPIYIGEQLGYFRDEHIKVTLVSLSTGDKLIFALLGGSINVVRYTPDWIIRAAEQGAKVKIVLGATNNLVFSLIGGAGIQGYADLRGKRIGISALAAADATLVKKMMAANGFASKDYNLIQAGSSPERSAALRSGSLAATILSPPEDQRIIDDLGFKRIDISTNVVKDYAWGGQAVREDWAAANKTTLVAYMRAWIRGFRWLHDPANHDEAIEILARETKLNEHFAAYLYDLYFGPEAQPVPADGAINMGGYHALLEDMVAQGQIGPAVPDAQKYVDTSYWQAAVNSLANKSQ